MVIFAHGSGSSRFSSRNRQVAERLQAGGFGTLLLDLLTHQEEAVDAHTTEYRFDIPRLGRRVVAAIDWTVQQPSLEDLRIGVFGASTGAAAALVAAAARPEVTGAVVSRGGRPDLAEDALQAVRAPTLLIVGGRDEHVIALNEDARSEMNTTVRLEIIAGATHLFEEEGALRQVELLALDWFRQYLRRGAGDEMLDGLAPGDARR